MTKNKHIVVGNWKMNGSRAMCSTWQNDFRHGWQKIRTAYPDVSERLSYIVCPPAPYLTYFSVAPVIEALGLGAQHVHSEDAGAYTGDLSASMLADAGCQFVLTGHSERRASYNERSKDTRARATAILNQGMRPIICIGENWDTRQAGNHEDWVLNQALTSLPPDAQGRAWLAYEPVWAIGQGRTPSSTDVRSMIDHLRHNIPTCTCILYGGSVAADNAAALADGSGIDGFLVGGASLKADRFLAIGEALLA